MNGLIFDHNRKLNVANTNGLNFKRKTKYLKAIKMKLSQMDRPTARFKSTVYICFLFMEKWSLRVRAVSQQHGLALSFTVQEVAMSVADILWKPHFSFHIRKPTNITISWHSVGGRMVAKTIQYDLCCSRFISVWRWLCTLTVSVPRGILCF